MNPTDPLPNEATDGPERTLYVFVRTDIHLEQQLVQAAHAAAEAARRHYRSEHGTARLVVLAVPDVLALQRARQQLAALGIEHCMFFEPDGDMGDSAIGTRPLLASERPLMRGWPLWKPARKPRCGAPCT